MAGNVSLVIPKRILLLNSCKDLLYTRLMLKLFVLQKLDKYYMKFKWCPNLLVEYVLKWNEIGWFLKYLTNNFSASIALSAYRYPDL